MYTINELCGRLEWSVNDLSVALNEGLRFYRFADTTYVFGSDVMDFVKSKGKTQSRIEQ
jgi:hypothetical protein